MLEKSKEHFAEDLCLPAGSVGIDLTMLSPMELQDYKALRAELAPFLLRRCKDEDVKRICDRFGLSRAKLFRKLKRFRADPRLTTLIERKSSAGLGTTRLCEKTEQMIVLARKRYFAKNTEVSFKELHKETKDLCEKQGTPVPSQATVARRYRDLSPREKTRLHHGAKAAAEGFNRVRGSTPERRFPLERIQIDHTLCDIWLVDSVTREPIGRPWITIAIDEFSRAVLSFVLTFEYPSATTVAYALTRAVLLKDDWLKQLKMKADWPFYGVPQRIYTDNGADFCSKEARYGCAQWGIPEIEKRPKGSPQYGGIIERLIGTVMEATKMLPGKTARMIYRRSKKYKQPSVDEAVMTIEEYEAWLAAYFIGEYHAKKHSTLGISPHEKWLRGVNGYGKDAGSGKPQTIHDAEKFFIDFLPMDTRRLSREGFVWDYIHYSDDMLQCMMDLYIGQSFVIRRNPHDIGKIYWLNPVDCRYYEIPAARAEFVGRTLWEVNRAKAANQAVGAIQNEESIMNTMLAQAQIVENAARQTKTTRKAAERSRHSAKLAAETAPKREAAPRAKISPNFVNKNFIVKDF